MLRRYRLVGWSVAAAFCYGRLLAGEPAFAQVPATSKSMGPMVWPQVTVDTLHHQWNRVRYNDAPLFRPTVLLVTSWGEVWTTDVGDRAVYRWSIDGKELPPVGRSGIGPGEYLRPGVLVELDADSVGVWDRQLQRMSFFGKNGEFLSYREIALAIDSHGFMTAVGFRNDTTMVVTANYTGPAPSPLDNRAMFWRFVGTGPRADSLLAMPGTRMNVFRQDGYATRYLSPFTPHAYAFFGLPGRVLVGYGGHDEITVYDHDMTRVATVGLDLPSLSVTGQDRNAFADSLSKALEDNVTRSGVGPSDRSRMRTINRRIVRDLDFPSTHPLYVDAFLGVDQLLWIRPAAKTDAEYLEWRGYATDTFRHERSVYLPNDGVILNTRTDGRSFFLTMQDELGRSYLAKYGT